MLVQPGPRTHDGLCYEPQDPAGGAAALAAIDALLSNPRAAVTGISEAERLARVWHDDMIWWDPRGSARPIRSIATSASTARRSGSRWGKDTGSTAISAGSPRAITAGSSGWANLTVRNAGGFMGMPAGAVPADMRVVDLYRVADGKLAENWIFIDLLHFFAMQGLDVLGRMAAIEDGGG